MNSAIPENFDLHQKIFDDGLFEDLQDIREQFDYERGADTQDCRETLFRISNKTRNLKQLEKLCESPLELMLGAALLWTNDGYNTLEMLEASQLTDKRELARLHGTSFFAPQVAVGSYRVDFLVASHFNGFLTHTAIECDGHDYHERTKTQASRDKERDRAILALRIPTLRFTGSQIHYKLDQCKEEITNYLSTRTHEVLLAAGLERPWKNKPGLKILE